MNKKLIYADHAATTPLSDAAWAVMTPFLREEFGNPSSLHSWARKPREAVYEARATIARCIGAEPQEIFFTSGGTESDNWVIKGTEGGLLVSAYEHHAVLNAAASEAIHGREVVYVRPKVGGYLMPETLSKKWTDGIQLVSVMTANNEIGTINPIKLLSEAAHKRGALFHTDAVQAVGHVPIDVHDADVDFLSASAHKFNGPKGICFLYIRKGLQLKQLIHGGQQESGLRAGTEHVELPGFVSVSFPGQSAEGIVHVLDLKGVAISAGAACDSKNTQISHVLRAINLPRKYAEGTVRITFGVENCEEDVRMILNAFKVALKQV